MMRRLKYPIAITYAQFYTDPYVEGSSTEPLRPAGFRKLKTSMEGGRGRNRIQRSEKNTSFAA
jgi:hypothetical protein